MNQYIYIPHEIKVIYDKMIKIFRNEYNLDEKIIERITRNVEEAKYIVYRSISEIDKEYLEKTNKLELILAYGVVQVQLEKAENEYKPKLICFIQKHNNINLMNITIIHELLHIMSMQQDVIKLSARQVKLMQGFCEFEYTLDKRGELFKTESNNYQDYINEAYTQSIARIIYYKIYKRHFSKTDDIYYARTMCIRMKEIVSSNNNYLVNYFESNIRYYKDIYNLPMKFVLEIKEIDIAYQMKQKNITKSVKELKNKIDKFLIILINELDESELSKEEKNNKKMELNKILKKLK